MIDISPSFWARLISAGFVEMIPSVLCVPRNIINDNFLGIETINEIHYVQMPVYWRFDLFNDGLYNKYHRIKMNTTRMSVMEQHFFPLRSYPFTAAIIGFVSKMWNRLSFMRCNLLRKLTNQRQLSQQILASAAANDLLLHELLWPCAFTLMIVLHVDMHPK